MLSDKKNGSAKNLPTPIVFAFSGDAHGCNHDRDHDRDRQVNIVQANLAGYPPRKNKPFSFRGD